MRPGTSSHQPIGRHALALWFLRPRLYVNSNMLRLHELWSFGVREFGDKAKMKEGLWPTSRPFKYAFVCDTHTICCGTAVDSDWRSTLKRGEILSFGGTCRRGWILRWGASQEIIWRVKVLCGGKWTCRLCTSGATATFIEGYFNRHQYWLLPMGCQCGFSDQTDSMIYNLNSVGTTLQLVF